MDEATKTLTFDANAYLAWEEQQVEKHEYIDGEVFTMGDVRRVHVMAAGNVSVALKRRLRGRPCEAFISQLKVHVREDNAFFYPDVVVSCHPEDLRAELALEHPVIIVEVLSPTTEGYDRGTKFGHYRKLASLQEYVLVDVDARRVEVFRRTADQGWLLHDYHDEHSVWSVQSLGLSISLAEIFEGIQQPSP